MTDDAATSGDDPDPEELQRELATIKSAMGLAERYPGQRRLWLFAGVAVAVAAAATNVSFAVELPFPNVLYTGIWFVLAGILVVVAWRLSAEAPEATTLPAPNWRAIFGGLVVALLALWTSLGSTLAETTEGAVRGAHYFGHLLVMLGLGFVVTGAVLRAQRIRRRDRLPFYVGGAWMFALAAVVPHVRLLQYWGYAVFGGLFLLHAVGTYLLTGD